MLKWTDSLKPSTQPKRTELVWVWRSVVPSAIRKCLDGLTWVAELDDFLGQMMVAITRQLGAVSSTLRMRDFEQNTLQLQFVFQDGQLMAPGEAKYPEMLAVYIAGTIRSRFPMPLCRQAN